MRRQAYQHREVPVAAVLVEIARRLAADCGLDRGVDVARRQAVAGGALAVDVDADGRLAEQRRHRKVVDAGHVLRARGLISSASLCSVARSVPLDLDGVLALHARGCLLDVVLDVLREVEVDARERPRSAHRCICAISVSLSRPLRHLSNGFSGTKNSTLKKPVASVPSSGRPCCETRSRPRGSLESGCACD